METSARATIAGVFREPARAGRAVEQLRQAGFVEDQCRSTVYTLSAEGQVSTGSEHAPGAGESRVVVAVSAGGREGEALGILLRNGANNGDLPPGIALIDGALVSEHPETTDLIPAPDNESSGFTAHSFFGELKDQDHEGDYSSMNNPPV
jgi:rhodanese-related sulfurtransferase